MILAWLILRGGVGFLPSPHPEASWKQGHTSLRVSYAKCHTEAWESRPPWSRNGSPVCMHSENVYVKLVCQALFWVQLGTRYKNPFCCGTDPTVYHMDLSAVAEHASIGGHLNRLERCGGRKPCGYLGNGAPGQGYSPCKRPEVSAHRSIPGAVRAEKWETGKSVTRFSRSIVSDFLRPHGLQHTRLPYPSPTPEACSNSCSLSHLCHPTISSCRLLLLPSIFPSIKVFSSESDLRIRWAKVLELQLQHQSFLWIFRTDFL